MKAPQITFRSLLENEAFCEACTANGYEAGWDDELNAPFLEDVTGRRYFKRGLRAAVVLSKIQADGGAVSLSVMLSEPVVAEETEYF